MKTEEKLLQIARKHLNRELESFAARGVDRLDFFEMSVTGVKDALLAAYELGHKDAGAKKTTKERHNDGHE